MAYNSVSTPRFYIDYFTHWLSNGLIKRAFSEKGTGLIGFPLGLEPSNPAYLRLSGNDSVSGAATLTIDFNEILQSDQIDSINYIAVLGHSWDKINIENQNDITGSIRVDCSKRYFENSELGQHSWRGSINRQGTSLADKNILNSEADEIDVSRNILPQSGASIYKASISSQAPSGTNTYINPETGEFVSDADISSGEYSGVAQEWNESLHGANVDRISVNIKGLNEDTGEHINGVENPLDSDWKQFNNISMGHFYDMPHSPDLKLTMDVQFDGSDTITTTGGSTITNIRYTGNPKWGELNCWEVGKSKSSIKRNGRRTWNLKFSYLSQNDLFASNYMSNTYMENSEGFDVSDVDTYNWGQDIVTNGTFTGNANGWTLDTGWAYDTNKVTCSSGNTNLKQDVGAVTGGIYKVTFKISAYTSGNLHVDIGNSSSVSFGSSELSAGITKEVILTATSNGDLRFYGGAFRGSLDDIKVSVANPSDFTNTLASDDSFFAKVVNYVGNGERFIFQPDKNSNNPSDFAICVLDQKSLKISQVSFKTYDISLKIKEVW